MKTRPAEEAGRGKSSSPDGSETDGGGKLNTALTTGEIARANAVRKAEA